MKKVDYQCKNCGNHLDLNQKFCSNCGQSTFTKRIDFNFLWSEIRYSIFHVNGGFFFTLKELFTRPGHTIREYLEGKRQKHFKLIPLITILGSISTLLNHLVFKTAPSEIGTDEFSHFSGNNEDGFNMERFSHYFQVVQNWADKHYALSILLFIPLFAFAYYLAFRKYQCNFAEWLIIGTFITAQSLAVGIVFVIINHYYNATLANTLIAGLLTFWTFVQFFNDRKPAVIILKSLLGLLFYFLTILMFLSLVTLFFYFISF